MSLTSRGKGWEARNSLWLIWVFVILFNWIAFFWIGGRTKQLKWILFGVLYLMLCFVMPFVAVEAFDSNNLVLNILMTIYFIAWIVSIIHAFLSRREYLIRREAIVANQEAATAAYRQNIQAGYIQQGNFQQPIYQSPSQPTYPQSGFQPNPQQNTPQQPVLQQLSEQLVSQLPQKIDLNTATEQQLTLLPGVGVALAKRAVDLREQTGRFASVQDFNQRLGLMPHFGVQIENVAFVSSLKPQTSSQDSKGRVIDI